ncbi:hypothetical protein SAMN02746065_104153 [Desulfocicer vacuolatum DSM 3385]|uniref:Uncharacterized protein n=1 Tax=Desulfocicer vacuolatum DSM 3385 TaxID=1121400 RepID=A0A1W2A6R7_9BACT|nr:hypothetical protein [Desulfocicer vacuolatum]SMC55958.1 hypothetical protein SAMN02746065_104153 [Desulfocicer vacuolatum DSM 3385]
MEEKIVKTIPLAHDLTLEILDLSRKISSDAFQVKMTARVTIPVKESIFTPESFTNFSLENIISKVGTTTTYEHKKERNFIMAPDKDTVFDQLVASFEGTLLPYVSKPSFPRKYILKCYMQ